MIQFQISSNYLLHTQLHDQLVSVGFELQMRVLLRWLEMVYLREID